MMVVVDSGQFYKNLSLRSIEFTSHRIKLKVLEGAMQLYSHSATIHNWSVPQELPPPLPRRRLPPEDAS